jgi:hypothetical protein
VNKALTILFMLTSIMSSAQDLPQKTQQQLENLADATEVEEEQDDNLLQQLEYFRRNPLNLNQATAADLQQLRLLGPLQIQHFFTYRKTLGPLLNVYELQAIPTWEVGLIQRLLPFVVVGPSTSLKENLTARLKGGEHSVLLRISRVLERSRGYDTSTTNPYLGDPNRLLFRYRYQYKNLLYWGVLGDKDAGEPFFKKAQSGGFDFYSVHLFARNLGSIKALALGDYTVNLGQGLIQWQSLAFGKSIDVTNIKRQSEIILPYRSPGEFLFNRGGAVTFGFGKWEATAFGSLRHISGNATDSSFSSFLTFGYHRTAGEQDDRNKVRNLSYGGNLSFRHERLKAGVNFVANQFSLTFARRQEPYNYFSFAGTRLWNGSVDYSYTFRNIHLFGEYAVDKDFNRAFVAGALISLNAKADLALLHRSLGERYQNLQGNAFTESTLPVNEQGSYIGLSLRPAVGWQVNAYADVFSFPWLRYRTDAPSAGSDYLLHIDYQPSRQAQVYALFRRRSRSLNEKGGVLDFPLNKPRQNLRLHAQMQVNKELTLKTRAELSWYDPAGMLPEEGLLIYTEGQYRRNRWQANARLQYFETDSYDSRIYAFESDVLYSFSIPAFSGKGARYYINVNYELGKHLKVWARWAQTFYQDRNSVGSGLDEIQGNRRSEIRIQAEVIF